MNLFEKHFGKSHVKLHPTYGYLVKFSTFIEVLRKAALPTDTVKYKKANIERVVNGYKNGTVLLDDGEDGSLSQWITSAGILKYIFKHTSEILFCSILAKEVEAIICNQQDKCENVHMKENAHCSPPTTILQLYTIVTKLSLRENPLEDFYTDFFKVDETSIPTLYTIHKDSFNKRDWEKIKYFEHHYALTYGSEPQKTSEAELAKRTKYLNLLGRTKEFKHELSAANKTTIQRRNLRRESGVAGVQMKGLYIHLYDALDRQLQVEVNKYTPAVTEVIALPSPLPNHVSIAVDVTAATAGELMDIHRIAAAYLDRKHNLSLTQISVITTDTLKVYYRKEIKGYARLLLHDDVITQKVKPVAIYPEVTQHDNDIDDASNTHLNIKCECCFPSTLPKPLEFSSFELLHEWVNDMPLVFQLLLESSINMRYFRESTDKHRFLKSKLTKLYMSYDTMLNILNYRYIGLLQQANALELIMHSKCLSTVFQVASSSGSAMSLAAASRYMESNTVDDLLYYNTYIKSHPLTYNREGHEVTTEVCLRQCVLILMVDNLVRLKYRDDPNPGENRSRQMNTLPITIQGIPLDSDEVASWHLNTCDGSFDCFCKESNEIPSSELAPLMVTLLPEEEHASRKFSQLCTWGYPGLWKKLLEGKFDHIQIFESHLLYFLNHWKNKIYILN